jgi:hypothetical protein
MMFSDGIGEQPSGEVWPTCGHSRYRACDGRTMKGSSISAVHFQRSAHPRSAREFPLVRGCVWSGAGSNRRPSAFQVNRAKRYADLRKRTSLTSGTALGGRCNVHANRGRYAWSTTGYSEGYTPSDGDAVTVPALSGEAIRLTRWLRRLLPDEPGVAGLLALMLPSARRPARTARDRVSLVPLGPGQDRRGHRTGDRRARPGQHPPVSAAGSDRRRA